MSALNSPRLSLSPSISHPQHVVWVSIFLHIVSYFFKGSCWTFPLNSSTESIFILFKLLSVKTQARVRHSRLCCPQWRHSSSSKLAEQLGVDFYFWLDCPAHHHLIDSPIHSVKVRAKLLPFSICVHDNKNPISVYLPAFNASTPMRQGPFVNSDKFAVWGRWCHGAAPSLSQFTKNWTLDRHP